MAVTEKLCDVRGQGTIEFAAALPVLIVVAAIAVNACLFFSECAAFDRVACQTVRAVAASPAYGQDVAQSVGEVGDQLGRAFDKDYLSTEVQAGAVGAGLVSFEATLDFAPTLFGLGLRDEVWGVPLPHMRHSVRLVLDPYKPGVFF